jgi:LmbE family N-acetylglucosaminyl deacetylase
MERRRAELMEACRRARFELMISDDLPPIGRDDDLERARSVLSIQIRRNLERLGAELIVGPAPEDGHHGHEVVGRAIEDAAEAHATAAAGHEVRVMFWGLWRDLAQPNLLVPFDAPRLNEIQHALAAHAGELERNRFDRLLEGRAMANAVLGPERVLGYGSLGIADPFAELLRDLAWSPGRGWRPQAPRIFDPGAPLGHLNAWESSGRSSSSR